MKVPKSSEIKRGIHTKQGITKTKNNLQSSQKHMPHYLEIVASYIFMDSAQFFRRFRTTCSQSVSSVLKNFHRKVFFHYNTIFGPNKSQISYQAIGNMSVS